MDLKRKNRILQKLAAEPPPILPTCTPGVMEAGKPAAPGKLPAPPRVLPVIKKAAAQKLPHVQYPLANGKMVSRPMTVEEMERAQRTFSRYKQLIEKGHPTPTGFSARVKHKMERPFVHLTDGPLAMLESHARETFWPSRLIPQPTHRSPNQVTKLLTGRNLAILGGLVGSGLLARKLLHRPDDAAADSISA